MAWPLRPFLWMEQFGESPARIIAYLSVRFPEITPREWSQIRNQAGEAVAAGQAAAASPDLLPPPGIQIPRDPNLPPGQFEVTYWMEFHDPATGGSEWRSYVHEGPVLPTREELEEIRRGMAQTAEGRTSTVEAISGAPIEIGWITWGGLPVDTSGP